MSDKLVFIEYPKCTTCQKAKKWLQERNIDFEDRHIKEQQPTLDELKQWHQISGLPLKRFFNTSGLLYKEMKLKDRLPSMTDDEMYQLLATDGMLVKRPILITPWGITTGFKEAEWERLIQLGLAEWFLQCFLSPFQG